MRWSEKANAQEEPSKVALSYSKSLKAPETDSLNLPVDENGYITIFDGETFNGWRGYGKDRVPTNGQSKMAVSNSTVLAAVKLKTVMVVT